MLPRSLLLLAGARVAESSAKFGAYVALTAVIYDETQSGTWVGLALLVYYASTTLLGPVTGVLVDRARRAAMLGSLLGAAVLYVVLGSVQAPGLIVLIGGLIAAAEAAFSPAASSAVPGMVREDQLAAANAVVGGGKNAGFLLGPLAAGACIAAAGTQAALWLCAGLLLMAAVLILAVHLPPNASPEEGEESEGPWREASAGFRELRQDPVLLRITVSWALVFCAFGISLPGEIALADIFDTGSVGYGVLVASWGGGALLGSVWGSRIRVNREVSALAWGAGICAVSLVLAAGAPVFPMAVLALVAGGLGEGRAVVAWQILMQRRVPESRQGRAFAASEAVSNAGYALPMVLAGALIDAWGVRWVYLLAGVVGALALLPLWQISERDPLLVGRKTG